MLIIGSHALRSWCNEKTRQPADVDLVGTFDEFKALIKGRNVKGCHPTNKGAKYVFTYRGVRHEFEIAWPGSSAAELVELVENHDDYEVVEHELGRIIVPSIHVLYLLKMTHRFKKNSIHFLKTMRDIQFLRRMGAVIKDEHMQFFKNRTAATLDYAHPKLNVSAKEFFVEIGDVKYVYIHDSIHEAVKHLERPAYEYFQKTGDQIWNSREMFEELPELTKLLSVLEEAYVLALERSQIPYPNQLTPRESFTIAMSKVCTNISSGWWREYAWENYDRVFEYYNDAYVKRFWFGVERGIVKKVA